MADPVVDLMHLRPLGESSVAALVAGALGDEPDPAFTVACHRATAGNPLALRGVIRDLAAQGTRPTASAAGTLERQVPVAVSRRLEVRLARLGDPATRLARGLAVMGDRTDLRDVAALMDLDEQVATAAADELAAADILDGELPPRFVHPLLRSAVYDSIPLGERSLLHRHVADLLSARGADAEAVAAHFLRSQPDSESDTLEQLRSAARSALARGAPDAACLYLRRGLVDGMEDTARVTLLSEPGRAELLAGDPQAVDHLWEAVNSCSDPVVRGRVRSDLADAVWAHGDWQLSMELRLRALGELGDSDPEASEQIEVRNSLTLATERSAPAGVDPEARLRAIAAGGGPSVRSAWVALAQLLGLRAKRRETVLSHLDQGLCGGSFLAQETSGSRAAGWAANVLWYTDELARAIAWAREMQSDAAARGSAGDLSAALLHGAMAAYASGLLADAEASSEAALQLGLPHIISWTLAATVQALTLLELGRPEAALAALEGTLGQPGAEGSLYAAILLVLRGVVLCTVGRRDEGVAALREGGEIASAMGVLNPLYLPWRSSLALNLPAEGRAEARSLAAAELEIARGMDVPGSIGVALRVVAAVEREADGVDMLREAVTVLEASPRVLELARAQLDLGAALRRLGHRTEAREPLLQALEIATRCGAVPLAERAREESLLAGARPRRARLSGVGALTPAELRVARLAAEGLSNREVAQSLFITTKTVSDNLGSAYGNLQITSRSELAAALAPAEA